MNHFNKVQGDNMFITLLVINIERSRDKKYVTITYNQ